MVRNDNLHPSGSRARSTAAPKNGLKKALVSGRTMEKARIPVKLHRRVCLVQTEDSLLAEEVIANRKLAQDIVGRLADRVLLVRPGRVDAIVQELQKMGHTPQVASGGG